MDWRKAFGIREKSLGELGEELAASHLRKKGYAILARNFSNPSGRRLGEIDIIARQAETIVFVEVKTRSGTALPEENISRSKLQRLQKIAAYYLKSQNLEGTHYRFDAVAVRTDGDAVKKEIRHLESIFF